MSIAQRCCRTAIHVVTQSGNEHPAANDRTKNKITKQCVSDRHRGARTIEPTTRAKERKGNVCCGSPHARNTDVTTRDSRPLHFQRNDAFRYATGKETGGGGPQIWRHRRVSGRAPPTTGFHQRLLRTAPPFLRKTSTVTTRGDSRKGRTIGEKGSEGEKGRQLPTTACR